MLLPGARLSRVKPIVQDYNRYSEWFSPLIRRSQINAHNGDRFLVAMRTEMHKVLTVTVDADYAIDYQTVSPTSFYAKTIATSIHIVDSAGTATERRGYTFFFPRLLSKMNRSLGLCFARVLNPFASCPHGLTG